MGSHFKLHAITRAPPVFNLLGTSHLIFTFSQVLLAEIFWVEPIVKHLYPLQVLASWTVKTLYVPPLILALHISHVDPSSISPYSLTEELKLYLSGLYLSSHCKKKKKNGTCLTPWIYMVLTLPDGYCLSLPATTPPRTWAVGRLGYINTISKLIQSGNPQLPAKIMTLYYDSCFKTDTWLLVVCTEIKAFSNHADRGRHDR